jgi:hypothetical protein
LYQYERVVRRGSGSASARARAGGAASTCGQKATSGKDGSCSSEKFTAAKGFSSEFCVFHFKFLLEKILFEKSTYKRRFD